MSVLVIMLEIMLVITLEITLVIFWYSRIEYSTTDMTSNNNFYTRSSKHETLVSNAKLPWLDIQIFQGL